MGIFWTTSQAISYEIQPSSVIKLCFKMNLDEDEAPPLLVDVEADGDELVKEPKPIKVPITIVTGKLY